METDKRIAREEKQRLIDKAEILKKKSVSGQQENTEIKNSFHEIKQLKQLADQKGKMWEFDFKWMLSEWRASLFELKGVNVARMLQMAKR